MNLPMTNLMWLKENIMNIKSQDWTLQIMGTVIGSNLW